MGWWMPYIRREQGPHETTYVCKICGHAEHNRDKTPKAWGRIRKHDAQAHPEQRLINKGRTA